VSTRILGKPIAQAWLDELAAKIRVSGIRPRLGIVMVGEDAASKTYVERKQKTAATIGVDVIVRHLVHATTQEVLAALTELQTKVDGIIVQLPLPKSVNTDQVLKAIPRTQDVDGLSGSSKILPATIRAILKLLEQAEVNIGSSTFALVGNGRLIGQPLAAYLMSRNITPIIIDANTKNPGARIKKADVVVVGTGVPGSVTADMVASHQVLIDAGYSIKDGRSVGDVDPQAYDHVRVAVPVPGGLGPVTVTALLATVYELALQHRGSAA
jgi:methylenetetrahydrofolate dehydrogenase (NADP+)/methenyltetrahydrofolate cyclohydrolase